MRDTTDTGYLLPLTRRDAGWSWNTQGINVNVLVNKTPDNNLIAYNNLVAVQTYS